MILKYGIKVLAWPKGMKVNLFSQLNSKEKIYSEERINYFFIINEWIGRRPAVRVDTGGDQSTGLSLPKGSDRWKTAAPVSVLDWFYKGFGQVVPRPATVFPLSGPLRRGWREQPRNAPDAPELQKASK